MAVADCLSEDDIAAFVAGQLPADQRRLSADHIDSCELCRRLVSALTAAAFATRGGAADEPSDPGLGAGDQLGRFVLTRHLGRGAMGEVWAARDQELDREVALKLLRLRGGALGIEATARLRREAQAMARLNHPNVVAIHELGADRDRVFCAMELVDGTTLRRWLESPRTWHEIVRVAIAIGRGIAAAHAVGLVHRDIKPENVLIASDGRTLISDFGLAKLADLGLEAGEADGPDRVEGTAPIGALTATGAMLGTPVYMSPEQLAGTTADARADQFSYCVTIHEALFGGRPFAGETIDELARDIARGAPRRPHPRGVPRGIVRCLARGLAADPAARWPAMTALVDRLERAARWPRRRRMAVGCGAAAAAAIAGAVVIARAPDPALEASRVAEQRIALGWNPDKRALLEARFGATASPLARERSATTIRLLDGYRARWMTARLDAWSATHRRGEQTTEALGRRLACFEQLADAMERLVGLFLVATVHDVEEAPQSVYRLEPIESCGNLDRLATGASTPGTPSATVAEPALRELEALHRAGRYAEALQRAPALIDAALRLGEPAVRARARFDLGTVQASGGRFADAEATLRLALQDAAGVRDHYLVAECWLRLLNVTGYGLLHGEAAAAVEPGARAAVAQAGNDPRQRADLAKTLGLVAASQSDPETARVQFAEARDRHIAARGANDPSVSTDEANLGAALLDLGHPDEAAEHFERAIAITRATLGDHHPAIVGAEHNLATIAIDRGDWATAERHARAAVAMNTVVAGPDYPGTATNRIHLARILREQKRFAEARAELDLARASLERSLPATHPSRLLFDIHVAELEEAEGHQGRAIELCRGVVDAIQHADVPATQRAWAVSQLAATVGRRAPRDGVPLYEQALQVYTDQRTAPTRGATELLQALAALALKAHQPAAALRWFDRLPAAAAAHELAGVRQQLERARATGR